MGKGPKVLFSVLIEEDYEANQLWPGVVKKTIAFQAIFRDDRRDGKKLGKESDGEDDDINNILSNFKFLSAPQEFGNILLGRKGV